MMSYQKTMSRIGWGMVAFMLFSQIGQGILTILSLIFTLEGYFDFIKNMSGLLVLNDIAIYGVGLPIFLLICKKIPDNQPMIPEKQMDITAKIFLKILSVGFCVMYLSNLLFSRLQPWIFGDSDSTRFELFLMELLESNSLLEKVLLLCVIPAVMEELVFRKYLYKKVGVYGDQAFILVSGLCFGMFHGNINQFMYASLLGFLLAWVYVASGDIRWCMLLHFIINFVGSVVSSYLLESMTLLTVFSFFILIVIILGSITLVKATKGKRKEQLKIYGKLLPITFKNSGMIVFGILFVLMCISFL